MSTWLTSNEGLIQTALMYTLLAASYQVAMRAGVASFAGVGFWAIGGYASAYLVQEGWATVPAIVVALGVCAIVGTLLALVLGRLKALYLAMATIAFVLIVQTVARTWDTVTGGPAGLFGIPVTVSTTGLLACVAVVVGGMWWSERGRSGRRLEVLRLDAELASVVGVNVRWSQARVFVLSAVIGGLAGALNALLFNTLNPDMGGFNLVVTALQIIVIGGIASWAGPLVGAFIVAWLPTWLAFMGDYRPIFQGLLIVVLVVYLPQGVTGIVQTAWRRARDWRHVGTPGPIATEVQR